MTIDWAQFTPWPALVGGAMIGAAASLLLLLSGRIAGVSGILGGLLRPARGDILWRLLFLAGLVAAPLVYGLAAPAPRAVPAGGSALLVAAGLLVGVGTRLGSGCTSGHGVCGLSRRSPRSLAATASFMAAGFATVYLVRHVLG